jgi:hypothetical protein
MNDWPTDLEYSLDKVGDQFIDEIYYKAFPHLTGIEVVSDLELQKKGVDKILDLSGKKVLVDEKRRRKDYGDILLEEYSNFERKTTGWLGRTKYTDYIAYILMDTKKVYLLPFLLLQKCWINNYKDWLAKYGRKFADNKVYQTSNIPIPTSILLEEIKKQITLWMKH